jgi:hypothetical protein
VNRDAIGLLELQGVQQALGPLGAQLLGSLATIERNCRNGASHIFNWLQFTVLYPRQGFMSANIFMGTWAKVRQQRTVKG